MTNSKPKNDPMSVQWSEPLGRERPKPPSPDEMNRRATEFWDVAPEWTDEMRAQALSRLKAGRGTWTDFEAFAKDFRARVRTGTCTTETLDWLIFTLGRVLDAEIPPTVFGASKKRGTKPDLHRKFQVAAHREALRRAGHNPTKIETLMMLRFEVNGRKVDKLYAAAKHLDFKDLPDQALRLLINKS